MGTFRCGVLRSAPTYSTIGDSSSSIVSYIGIARSRSCCNACGIRQGDVNITSKCYEIHLIPIKSTLRVGGVCTQVIGGVARQTGDIGYKSARSIPISGMRTINIRIPHRIPTDTSCCYWNTAIFCDASSTFSRNSSDIAYRRGGEQNRS